MTQRRPPLESPALHRGHVAAIRANMLERDAKCAIGEHEPYSVQLAAGVFIWWCRNPWCWWHRPDFSLPGVHVS